MAAELRPSENLTIPFGSNINDSGEITGATGNAQAVERAVVLIPSTSGDALHYRVSVPKIMVPESLRLRLRSPRARFWDLRKKLAVPR